MWSKTQAWEMWPYGWPDCRMLSVPVSHTINNWGRIPVVAGFVVLCGANIVGNIISAEKRCNYPGRSQGNPASYLYLLAGYPLRGNHQCV